ncbi:MAG: hypothetical protein BAJATHORv1_10277 [Candidatus Thorarchaeota archaeon]|nr:MAG: hypothetical protein BAJATHORv1_10277 [Candidatus Thorarchaeota archaeon]
MKRTSTILIILIIPLFVGVFITGQTPTAAWGLNTHQFIVSEAMSEISNDTWAEVFEYYSPEILSGCTLPDTAWQDWDNHLYYPETGEYNAPNAAKLYYDYALANFSAENWVDGFVAVGVMTHYFSDPCIPIHTGPNWPGHSGYERDINEHLNDLTLIESEETEVENVSQMVVDAATYSHQYYDTVVEAYDDDDSRVLMSDTEIKTLTEECLSMAINGCLSLFYTLSQEVEAPDITIELTHVAVVDYAHNNDYIDYAGEDELSALNQSLAREGFEMRKQTTAFTSGDLTDAELLIITCALEEYSSSELSAISSWASSGNKTLIITGRGDYSEYVEVARSNQILEEIGSDIRINDDNVYMEGTYQPFYNDLTEIPSSTDTVGLTEDVDAVTFFSPTSLYFLDDDAPLPIIYADASGYQTNQNPPAISVIYDDQMDGKYGDQIILGAAEEIGSFRLVVTGTTFFSNFDYQKSVNFDNIVLLENILEWAKGIRLIDTIPLVDEVGPRIGELTTTTQQPISEEMATFTASVSDPSGVKNVSVEYVLNGITHTFAMTGSDGQYTVDIPNPGTTVNLRVVAYDNDNNYAIRGDFAVIWERSGGIDPLLIAIIGIAAVVGIVVVVILIKMR